MILPLLSAVPTLLSGAQAIFNAVTGTPAGETPAELAAQIADLAPEQQSRVLAAIEQLHQADTARFLALTEGDAEKIRATARPQIALQAMGVIRIFAWSLSGLFFLAIADWLLKLGFLAFGRAIPDFSIWKSLADAAPAAEMIWAPALGAFWACVSIIKKYMGCRERDKAIEAEIRAGRPLTATGATIAAASEGVAAIVRSFQKRDGR